MANRDGTGKTRGPGLANIDVASKQRLPVEIALSSGDGAGKY